MLNLSQYSPGEPGMTTLTRVPVKTTPIVVPCSQSDIAKACCFWSACMTSLGLRCVSQWQWAWASDSVSESSRGRVLKEIKQFWVYGPPCQHSVQLFVFLQHILTENFDSAASRAMLWAAMTAAAATLRPAGRPVAPTAFFGSIVFILWTQRSSFLILIFLMHVPTSGVPVHSDSAV